LNWSTIIAAVVAAAVGLPRLWELLKPYIKNKQVSDQIGKGVGILSSLAMKSKSGEAERFAMLLAWRDDVMKQAGLDENRKALTIDAINQLIAVSFASLNITSSPLVAAGLVGPAAATDTLPKV
jgi:hypothetical protein